MTLLINKDFVCHGIRVTIALPESYDATKTYPAVFLNDGQLDYLGKLADSVIPVSYTHLDVYKRQVFNLKPCQQGFFLWISILRMSSQQNLV